MTVRQWDSTNVRGVEELWTGCGAYGDGLWRDGWAPSVIRVNGVVFVAAALVAHLTGDRSPRGAVWGHRQIKYGPGGRRLYAELTEKLCEEMTPVDHSRGEHGKSAYQARVKSWEILVDLLKPSGGTQ
jgi:hypothetical protein